MQHKAKRFLWVGIALVLFSQGLLCASDAPFKGWEKIETEHFELVFEPEDVQSAQHVASFADEVYQKLADLLGYAPVERIPVVIAGRTPWSNGYYSPFPSAVYLFVTSPDDRFLGSRSADWLRSLFTHEVTHYIHLTSPVGLSKYLVRIFGPGVTAMNTPLMDGWWIEGITTFSETAFAEGGRGDSSLFALTYESALQEDAMWSLSQGNYQSDFHPSGRIYTTGYLMVDYLMRTYGLDLFSKVNSSFAWFPFLGVSHALKKETGFSGKELFSFALKEKENTSGGADRFFLSPGGQGDYYLPYVTEQGLVGFSSTLDDGGALVSYGKEGLFPIKRLPIYDSQALAVAQDGQNAVFSMYWADTSHRASLSLAPVGYADLYRYSLAFDSFDRITTKQQLYQPALSADGSRLVALERVASRYRLVEVEQKTGDLSLLYDEPKGSVYEPQISPGGNSVVAIEIIEGRSALIEIDDQQKKTVLVGYSTGDIRNPRFIDADTLYFSSDETGVFCLYRFSFLTKTVERILSDSLGILGAVQLNDQVYYEAYTAQGYALCSLPLSSLTSEPVLMGTTVFQKDRENPKTFAIEPYRDYPRFNLFLPLPLSDGEELVPAVWTYFSSVLKQHQIIAQAGYSFQDGLPLLSLAYSYTPGPFSLDVSAYSNQTYGSEGNRQQLVEVNTLIPVWQETAVTTFQQIATNMVVSFISRPDTLFWGTALQASYQVAARSAAKDFFGSSSISTYAGLVGLYEPSSTDWIYRPYGGITTKMRVGGTHQNVALSVDALATSSGSLLSYLPFEGSLYGKKDGNAKALLSVYYQIPLGLFDQPVPYGGLTAMGLSLWGQSALYLQEEKLAWEEDVYVGAKLTAEIVLGSSASLKPFFGLAVSAATGNFTWFVGINSLFQTGLTSVFPW
jgi:hypothetical protein